MDQCLHNDDSNSVTKLKGLHIAHLNCRSLVKHTDELRLFLAGSKIDILSLNETRLSHDIPDSEVDELSKNIDHGYINVICAVDMAKGFDTICHSVLLHKLSFYGFNQNSVNFFRSYLSNRCQKVKLDNGISSDMPIKIGVPQGSILGPLLYLIYVNDLY